MLDRYQNMHYQKIIEKNYYNCLTPPIVLTIASKEKMVFLFLYQVFRQAKAKLIKGINPSILMSHTGRLL